MMKTIYSILIAMLISLVACCQSDTSKKNPSISYVEIYESVTNTSGSIAGKSNLSIEFGKQWDVFSMGVDMGKTTLDKFRSSSSDPHGVDNSVYFEIRPNLNVFQQGKFTNTVTVGIGYIINAKENLLTEFTSGIEYAYNDKVHFNLTFGQFYYSGIRTSSSVTFFGTSVSYYFAPYFKSSGMIK